MLLSPRHFCHKSKWIRLLQQVELGSSFRHFSYPYFLQHLRLIFFCCTLSVWPWSSFYIVNWWVQKKQSHRVLWVLDANYLYSAHFSTFKKNIPYLMERDQGNKLMHWCRTVKRMDMIESATFFRVWSSAPIFVICWKKNLNYLFGPEQ